MKKTEISIVDLDDLQFRLSCGVGVTRAVQECVEHGYYAAEDYADALYGACLFLDSISKDLRELIDGPEVGEAVPV